MARTVAVITSADAATMWLRPYLYPLRGNSRYADPAPAHLHVRHHR
jgi:hypothetical protein